MISFELLAFSGFLAVFAAYFRPYPATERLSMDPWRNCSRNGSLDIGGNPSRNPFGNPFIRASRVSGSGQRPQLLARQTVFKALKEDPQIALEYLDRVSGCKP